MNDSHSTSFLLVDDDGIFRARMARALVERGFAVCEAADADAAMAAAGTESPELALVDLRLPGMSGLELLRQLKRVDPATQVVVLTGYGSIATALQAVRLGATNYLTKPADADDVVRAFGQRSDGVSGCAEVPSLARVEWEHINRVLLECDGNITKAARLLGIHRRSLQRKLSKHPTLR